MLRRRRERAGRPAPDAWIFPPKPKSKRTDRPGVDGSNYRSRHFAWVCERAELGPRKPKDLRDTYASHLLSAGIQLAYISQQLGHANTDVTASAYARWCGGATYREALRLPPGEVPADLLALELPRFRGGLEPLSGPIPGCGFLIISFVIEGRTRPGRAGGRNPVSGCLGTLELDR